jgi:hypothetical protein
MNFYSHRTVEEQKNRLPEAFQENYEKTQLDRIEIDGEEILGYFEYSFMEEKTYKTQPVRSNDGSIQDLESYQTFLTPRLIIKYNMMAIEDYRKLMKKLKSKNTFVVTCYDIVEDKRVTHEMYFAPPSMPIIYQRYLMAMGIQDFSIELIGTNYKEYFTITYDFNLPPDMPTPPYNTHTQYAPYDEMNTIGNIYFDSMGMSLKDFAGRVDVFLEGWNTHPDGSGWTFNDDMQYLISSDYVLYAQWRDDR